jgi:hypothetical protein
MDESWAGFQEEAPKVIERGSAGKRICQLKLLFSQVNNLICGLTRNPPSG